MRTGTNFPGQNRSSSSRRAFQLIQKDEESQGAAMHACSASRSMLNAPPSFAGLTRKSCCTRTSPGEMREVCQRTTALCKQRLRVYYTMVRIRHAHAFAQSAKSADRCIDNRKGNVLVFSRACTMERLRGKRCPESEIPATHV